LTPGVGDVQNEASFVRRCLDDKMESAPVGYGFISIIVMDPRQNALYSGWFHLSALLSWRFLLMCMHGGK